MIPRQYSFNMETTQKTQNSFSGSKTPKQPMIKKLDLNWDRKLEKLLNNTDTDQSDYFQVYSDASNTTISTICINSNESRFTDSYWSDTDVTRRDDIVIELSERAFYSAKVNPFPQPSFSATSYPEKNLSKIIEDDDKNIEDVAPTEGVSEVMIDVRNNEDLTGVSNEADDKKSENVIYDNGMAFADRTANENADVQHNEDVPTADEPGSDFTDNRTNEALTCGLSSDLVNDQENEDLAAADDVSSKVPDSQNNNENLIHVDTSEVTNCCNNEDLAPPIDDVTNGAVDQQSNGDVADEIIDDVISVAVEKHNNEEFSGANIDEQQNNKLTDTNIDDATNGADEQQIDRESVRASIDKSNIIEGVINVADEQPNNRDLADANMNKSNINDDATNGAEEQQIDRESVCASIDKSDIIDGVINVADEQPNNGDLAGANMSKSNINDDATNGAEEQQIYSESVRASIDKSDIIDGTINVADEQQNSGELADTSMNKSNINDDVTTRAEEQQIERESARASIDKSQIIDGVINVADDHPNNGDLASANMSKSNINEDQNYSLISDVNATQVQVNSMENVGAEKITPEKTESTIVLRRSTSSRNNANYSDVESNDWKPKPISSTSSKNNSCSDMRKKRYRKTVDTNHRKNMERQMSKSSGCTQVTSTTTVQVTTNDDTIFDALADMPEFVNSSVIDLASSYIENRMRQEKNLRTKCIDSRSALPSSSSSFTPSWRNEKLSSIYDEYISPREAYKQLNALLRDGTNENLKAVMYDEYNGIRFDDDIASSEDEFLSDVDDLNLTDANWTPPESELRRQVAIILKKIHPLENNYSTIIDDILCKYLNYIHTKQRISKVNRIVDCVNKPLSQQKKTEMLIRREIDDKKLNREFYHSPMEPSDFTELGERRREAIIRKYQRCHNDRKFCYSYFQRSIDDRPVSKLGWRIAKLKQELELIFA